MSARAANRCEQMTMRLTGAVGRGEGESVGAYVGTYASDNVGVYVIAAAVDVGAKAGRCRRARSMW